MSDLCGRPTRKGTCQIPLRGGKCALPMVRNTLAKGKTMPTEDEIVAVGPFGRLRSEGCLGYEENRYAGVKDDDLVMCTVAQAHTTSESSLLAEMCGLDTHTLDFTKLHLTLTQLVSRQALDGMILEPVDETIGDVKVIDLYWTLRRLLSDKLCQVWYRPMR